MRTADGRYTMVFNGEIYNFREIRAALEERGHRPRSSGDAEVLLLALQEWGPAALERLNGMFALALHDAHEHTLLLARDHAGIKPLYYARTQTGVVFGSQYDLLVAHPWMRGASPDPGALGLYLRFGFLPAPHGLHAGTAQVEAGEWVRFGAAGTPERGRFYALPRWRMPVLKDAEANEALDEALARAVKRHLESDVPVGVLLSGGVDSPLVAAEAVRQHGGSLEAFTIGVTGSDADESDDARRFATELGLQHRIEQITANDVLGLLDDVVAASTEPTADYSMFPTLMVSRLAHRHVKVVLSGDGGDELYWGYPSRFVSAIAQGRYFAWPRIGRYAATAARRLFGLGEATRDVLDQPSIGRLYQRKHTLMAEGDLAAVFPTLPRIPATYDAFTFEGTSPDDVAQWVRWNEFHVHLARVLAKVDRASMFHSLEVRVPLLDKEVIDVAWQTSWRSCIDLTTRIGKRPLRAALARRVTHQTTTKKGFTVPMKDWLVGPLRPLVREHLFGRRDLLGLPIAPGSIEAIEARLQAGEGAKAWGLWLLLSLALWDRTYGGGTA